MKRTSQLYLALLATGGTALSVATIGPAIGSHRTVSGQVTLVRGGIPLVTGKYLTPQGTQTNVGSYPCNLMLSPDGKYVVVTSLGARSRLSVLNVADGSLVSKVDFDGEHPTARGRREGLFYGLSFAGNTLYAARGSDDRVSVLNLDSNGTLTRTDKQIVTPSSRPTKDKQGTLPLHVAGIALSSDGSRLYIANNSLDPNRKDFGSTLNIANTATGNVTGSVELSGYPFAVAALTTGPNKDKKVYVTSEQRGTVAVIDPTTSRITTTLATGANPAGLLLNKAQTRLFVSNAHSDTISIVETNSDKITKTILVRPTDLRDLAAATPLGMALSPDEKTLYVALGDMNAVAIVDLDKNSVRGYVPVGWYPNAVVVSPDGSKLFVSNAKGVAVRNPNSKPNPEFGDARGNRSQYIQNIIEGTVSTINVSEAISNLPTYTAQVAQNNRVTVAAKPEKFTNPGIEHVIYIIKENRTYDQVLSDLPIGNNDKSVLMFGRDVTPNQHALAERFVLLDNFYCAAEVSGDGWNMSTQGMVNEYNSRNVVYGYTGKVRTYDYEGTNNGIPVDRLGVPDVSRAPGGYIWDRVAEKKLPFRNYGFFVDNFDLPRNDPERGPGALVNEPDKTALVGKSAPDFAGYDTDYPDSEAWVKHSLPPAPKQIKTFGKFNDPARMTAWLREFNEYVKNKNLPRFMMVRLGRDHTGGTAPGNYSPRAMVADNDYAVGQLVEAISKSPYWKKTAIFVIEDDAQNGFDHVDAHRSIAFVVSPYIRRGTLDSRFYNTDSMLRTMGLLLGTKPMSLYDAAAFPMAVFTASADNDAPFNAILPAKEIIGEINPERNRDTSRMSPAERERYARRTYRADDSARLLNPRKEESDADEELNDILWHSIKGLNTPKPARRYNLTHAPARDND